VTDKDDATIEEEGTHAKNYLLALKAHPEAKWVRQILDAIIDIATRRGEERDALKLENENLRAQSVDGKCAVPSHPNWSPAQITTINYEETCQHNEHLKSERYLEE